MRGSAWVRRRLFLQGGGVMEYGNYPIMHLSNKKKLVAPLARLVCSICFFYVGIVKADWVAGVTTDVDTNGIGGVVEYHAKEFGSYFGWSANFAGAARLDDDGDGWIGMGVAGKYELGERFVVEASFMPGAYKTGETDLGGQLHFRSLIGVGYKLSETTTLSFSIDHLSNGSTQSENPGSDAFTLRFIHSMGNN